MEISLSIIMSTTEINQQNPDPRSARRHYPSRLFGRRFIKQGFQTRFSLVIYFLFIALVVINWIVGRSITTLMLHRGLVNSHDFLIQLSTLNKVIITSSSFGFIIIYIVSLVFSHLIAGPIYRLESVLKEVAKGHLSQHIKLRRFDEFKEVAEVFNDAMKNLRSSLEEDEISRKEELGKLHDLCEQLKKSGMHSETDALKKILQEFPAKSKHIQY